MAAHTHAWPQTSEARSYYTFGGDRVAMRTGGEVHYLHADHLGTAALTSDSNVAAIHVVRRYLFGAQRWTSRFGWLNSIRYNSTMALLTKRKIEQALTRLGALAQAQNDAIELVAVGGAAMVLLYNARSATHDVDVYIVAPPRAQQVRELAEQVGQELDLAPDWLNDGAKAYLIGLSEGETIFSAPGIVVKSPATAQLLAMKLSAWRDDVDIEDARRLLTVMAGSQSDIWAALEPYLYPGLELKAEYAFLDLWESTYGTD